MVHVRTNHWHGQHHSDLQFEYCKPPSLDIPVVSLGGHGLLRFGFKRDELDAPGPIDCTEHALEAGNALPQGVGYAIPPMERAFGSTRSSICEHSSSNVSRSITRLDRTAKKGWGGDCTEGDVIVWDGMVFECKSRRTPEYTLRLWELVRCSPRERLADEQGLAVPAHVAPDATGVHLHHLPQDLHHLLTHRVPATRVFCDLLLPLEWVGGGTQTHNELLCRFLHRLQHAPPIFSIWFKHATRDHAVSVWRACEIDGRARR